ncbi:MAG: MerC domain-containing protein [Nanoarchaeota archaeon]|nr:MerC domain-containing protein [Nanoarchaeota archaeon]
MEKGILGAVGTSVFGLCCAGLPILLAGITTIGLSFIINDFILFPLLFISLGFMFNSLFKNKNKHKIAAPLYIAMFATVLILVGIFIQPVIWLGIIILFIATIYDYKLMTK